MFLQRPHFSVGGKSKWILTKPCVYMSPHIDYTVTVPEGFETDLASIPRMFTYILPINDRHRLAAVVHDYMYARRGVLPGKIVTRKQADQVFYEAMMALKVPKWKAWTMYRGVRAGGWVHWRR